MNLNTKNEAKARELLASIRSVSGPNIADVFIPALYLVYKAKENGSNDVLVTIKDIKRNSKDLKNIENYLSNISFGKEEFQNICRSYSNEDIQGAIEIGIEELSPKRYFTSTPKSIIDLSKRLLEIKAGDTILDQGSGLATFLTEVCEEGISGTGVEINPDWYAFSMMRSEIVGKELTLKQMDAFELPQKKYDKVFSNCPFGMRVNMLKMDNINIVSEKGVITKNTSADWAFSLNAVNKTKESGKTLSIVTAGCLINKPDQAVREFLIKNRMVESVILLPKKLFSGTSIQTAVIVISKGNNFVNFVNATEIFTAERRNNTLSKKDIESIINALGNDSNIGKVISNEEIKNNAYCLDPLKYLEKAETRTNDMQLGDFITVRRAARLTASELDEYVTEEKTNLKYLSISDVNDYEVSDNLSCFNSLPDKCERYAINDKDILITRAAVPYFKSAIYEKKADETVIANGNVYMITVDETKLNPYYLLAFFNSSLGQERLMAGSAGAAAIMLPTESIKSMRIPMVSMAEQTIIGDRMKKLIEDIKVLNQKIETKTDEITKMF